MPLLDDDGESLTAEWLLSIPREWFDLPLRSCLDVRFDRGYVSDMAFTTEKPTWNARVISRMGESILLRQLTTRGQLRRLLAALKGE